MRTLPLALSAVVILAACSMQEPQRPVDPEDGRPATGFEVTDDLPAGTFASNEGSYNGELFVRGYSEQVTVDEPFCVENCQTFRYVRFRVLETGNDNLGDFMRQNEGNAYVSEDALGLGCIREDGVMVYTNHSDQYGMRESEIGAPVAASILSATESDPVTLKLTKLALSGGSEAPACYSHFTEIAIRE